MRTKTSTASGRLGCFAKDISKEAAVLFDNNISKRFSWRKLAVTNFIYQLEVTFHMLPPLDKCFLSTVLVD